MPNKPQSDAALVEKVARAICQSVVETFTPSRTCRGCGTPLDEHPDGPPCSPPPPPGRPHG